MNGTRGRRFVPVVLWIAAPVAILAVLRPWTIRSIDDERRSGFNTETFAASAWPRLVREALQTAVDVAEVAMAVRASPVKPGFVKGTGVVSGIDRQSRVGVMRLHLAGSTPATVAVQIGPVIRGTALRDAAGFIQFSDFTNQFDYAGAANALNDQALRTVVASLPIDGLQGRTVAFIGAVGKAPVREDGAIEIVPVQLEVVGADAK